MSPKSQALAEMAAGVQKDTWHVESWGSRVRHDLQRMDLAALTKPAFDSRRRSDIDVGQQ